MLYFTQSCLKWSLATALSTLPVTILLFASSSWMSGFFFCHTLLAMSFPVYYKYKLDNKTKGYKLFGHVRPEAVASRAQRGCHKGPEGV